MMEGTDGDVRFVIGALCEGLFSEDGFEPLSLDIRTIALWSLFIMNYCVCIFEERNRECNLQLGQKEL